MSIEKIKSVASSAAAAVDSKLKDSISFLSDLKEAGWEKIKYSVNDILGLAPLIEVTGFSMKDVSVDASIPPSITLAFVKEKDVDPATIEKLIGRKQRQRNFDSHRERITKSRFITKGMKLSHYNFRGLSMKIGLPPDISLKFTKMEKQVGWKLMLEL
jgi:hypothetical protein